MEKKVRKVVYSRIFRKNLQDVYEYGVSTFGENAAAYFLDEVIEQTLKLNFSFFTHPECRHLRTKSKMYRNIIIGSYLIIYRITDIRIEVLSIIHGSRRPSYIKNIRSINL